ncbi:MAG: hypothetical protein ABI901_03090, partial [Roseiflexaceae bacterium]
MDYNPVIHATTPPLQVTALVGTTTVVLGFDLVAPIPADLLGFAVRRVDLDDGAAIWLKNPLKFASTPYAGYQVAGTDTRQAPIQQFHWLDEVVQSDHTYRYTVALVAGTPAQPLLGTSCDLTLRTAPATLGDTTLIFNRGTTATPAYRTQFDTLPLTAQPPTMRAAAASYLSRGLREGLLQFLGAAV